MAFNKIESQVLEYLEPIAAEADVEIWDIEFQKEGPNHVLRVYLDKAGGICLDDCETVSRALAYLLEVSSAGLDRAIKYKTHFEKCMGKNVDVKLFAPVDGTKEFTAALNGFDGKTVTFQIDGEAKTLPLEKISSIRLSIEF